jgi:hypothetical protein
MGGGALPLDRQNYQTPCGIDLEFQAHVLASQLGGESNQGSVQSFGIWPPHLVAPPLDALVAYQGEHPVIAGTNSALGYHLGENAAVQNIHTAAQLASHTENSAPNYNWEENSVPQGTHYAQSQLASRTENSAPNFH